MQWFKSARHTQRFLAAYGPISSDLRPQRHRLLAPAYRQEMRQRLETRWEITGLAMAAQGRAQDPSLIFPPGDHVKTH
jgi:putative transposase